MIWTLIAFRRHAVRAQQGRASRASPRRSTGAARRSRTRSSRRSGPSAEADELLEEYRARLKEAREQAEDIVARARKAAESLPGRVEGAGHAAARGADGRGAPRHRGRDAPLARGDPQGGGQPHGAGHREGHAQVAERGRPAAARGGGARRGRLLRAVEGRERREARWRRSPRSTRVRCSRLPRRPASLDRVHDELGEFADALDERPQPPGLLLLALLLVRGEEAGRAPDRERRRRALRELPGAARRAPPHAGDIPDPARASTSSGPRRTSCCRSTVTSAVELDDELVERHRQAHRGADGPAGGAELERRSRPAGRPRWCASGTWSSTRAVRNRLEQLRKQVTKAA